MVFRCIRYFDVFVILIYIYIYIHICYLRHIWYLLTKTQADGNGSISSFSTQRHLSVRCVYYVRCIYYPDAFIINMRLLFLVYLLLKCACYLKCIYYLGDICYFITKLFDGFSCSQRIYFVSLLNDKK